jgi:hypothetical protein
MMALPGPAGSGSAGLRIGSDGSQSDVERYGELNPPVAFIAFLFPGLKPGVVEARKRGASGSARTAQELI